MIPEPEIFDQPREQSGPSILRDLLSTGFRHRRLVVGTFLGVFFAAVIVTFLVPRQYKSEMKILVRQERVDELVSPNQNSGVVVREGVSEEELQSESELLKSRDLLESVVVQCGLNRPGGFSIASSLSSAWNRIIGRKVDVEKLRIAGAVIDLQEKLTVEPLLKTNLIQATYESKDPEMAANVLKSLASLYLEKHLAIHRPPGAYEFFQQQSEHYQQELDQSQQLLANHARTDGAVSPALQKELAVRKLADAEAQLRETRTAIQEAQQQMQTLQSQESSVPARRVSLVRTADNPELMQQLKGTLLNLELKRLELLSKYDASYDPVKEVDAQIAKAKDSIATAQKEPLRDETTDRDPTYEWITSERTKAASTLSGLRAREAATVTMVDAYRDESRRLEKTELDQEDLLRQAKTNEDNYLLYQRKMEEARISDALDRRRIANVVVAEPAEVPMRPSTNRLLMLLAGLFLAGLTSATAALIANRADRSLRTPDDVRMYFETTVVAAIPKALR